jgi:hypothetical protein
MGWSRTSAVIGAALIFGTPALSHSWYPAWCCSDHDCRALDEAGGETVTETAKGWKLWDGRIVVKDRVKTSPDEKFHLCEEARTKVIICFFAPPGAS